MQVYFLDELFAESDCFDSSIPFLNELILAPILRINPGIRFPPNSNSTINTIINISVAPKFIFTPILTVPKKYANALKEATRSGNCFHL